MDNSKINDNNKKAAKKFKHELSSTQIILLCFFLAIIVGTILLLLPISTAQGESTDLLTALFTATTSVCVTGLVVVDTFSHWSIFGKVIILFLIQLGGLGIITIAGLITLLIKKKVSLKNKILIQDAFNLDSMQGLSVFVKRVVRGTFIVEGAGAVLYSFYFIPIYGPIKGIWVSVFNSISAFCNAGIDILGANSLMDYATDPYINIVTMLLIVLGGLGFIVWFDLIDTAKFVGFKQGNFGAVYRRLREHTKIILIITLILIFGGALLIFIFEYNNEGTIGKMTLGQKILASIFQSVTFRTAGFAAVPQENLTDSSFILGLLLMFIGGSPVGTAGGVKTMTICVLFFNMMGYVSNREDTTVFKKTIATKNVTKAVAVVSISFLVTVFLMMLLVATCNVEIRDAAFEVVSATATVGLSRGLTSSLNPIGKVIIIVAMYLGRVGPISMALVFGNGKKPDTGIKYSDGKFIIG